MSGAAGGIGQPLALLLKASPLISELSLYDIVGTEGVGADLSHIDSSPKVGPPVLKVSTQRCTELHVSPWSDPILGMRTQHLSKRPNYFKGR